MSVNNHSTRVANAYFTAWKARDFAALRALTAEAVSFVGSLGQANGADECVRGLQGLSNIMTDTVIQKMLADESDVMTWYELHTKVAAPCPTVNWMHLEDGKIKRIRVTFDPRPLL